MINIQQYLTMQVMNLNSQNYEKKSETFCLPCIQYVIDDINMKTC